MTSHPTGRIDRNTAEALLRGVPGARDAAGRLGAQLAAAASAAQPHELAGLPAALEAFRAVGRQPAIEPRRGSMIKAFLAKLLTIKAAAILACGAAGGVALAAGTGAVPNPLTRPPVSTPQHVEHSGRPSAHPAADRSHLPSPSLLGLCRAFAAGAGKQQGKSLSDPAFSALIKAAGGQEKVAAFCASLPTPSDGPRPHPSDSAHPSAPVDHRGPGGTHPGGPPASHPEGPPSTHPTH